LDSQTRLISDGPFLINKNHINCKFNKQTYNFDNLRYQEYIEKEDEEPVAEFNKTIKIVSSDLKKQSSKSKRIKNIFKLKK
jgi:hypothetical protein